MSRVLSIANSHVGRVCLLHKDRPTAAHAHLEPHAMLLLDGEAQAYRVGDSSVLLDRDHAVLVNAQELHANEGPPAGSCVVLMLYLSPAWLATRTDRPPSWANLFGAASVRLGHSMHGHVLTLVDAMQRATGMEDERVAHALENLANALCQAHSVCGQCAPVPAKQSDFRIRRAISLMQDSIEEPLSAAEIGARVGLSRSRFFELFLACTGLSPKHYANMLRLNVATQRLVDAQERIGEISHQCGFGAQSHFSKFFVEQQGFTPREYRRAAAPLTAVR